MRECPVSYCNGRMERGETIACTPCIRRMPRPLRRDVWLANHDILALAADPSLKSEAFGEVETRVLAWLEANPRGVARRRGRFSRRRLR